MDGVSDTKFKEKYSISFFNLYEKQIEDQIEKGYLIRERDRIRLTEKGMLFGNDVFAAFLLDEGELGRFVAIDS